jgi:class 3 adenylate cyclase/HAMP domain-containing protein
MYPVRAGTQVCPYKRQVTSSQIRRTRVNSMHDTTEQSKNGRVSGLNDSFDRASPSYSNGSLPKLPPPLSSVVDLVARIHASVHIKLLSGFLIGALLLLGMAILSLVVINRMDQQMDRYAQLQENMDLARQMEYLVTSQSHFRAMALLTRNDAENQKIENAKVRFLETLDTLAANSGPERQAFFQQVREVNQQFAESGERVLALYESGRVEEALQLHLAEEHEVSHVLETAMRELIAFSSTEMEQAAEAFESDRQLLTTMVWAFSGVSLVSALLLGLVLSMVFIRPVRRIDVVLSRIALGDFNQRVDVPNRDEFGTLSRNLNVMSGELARLYEEQSELNDSLQNLNENLQRKVDEQVRQLERAMTLRRYLSPQLAESILGGTLDVDLSSRRRNLTIFFSDVRGFTAMSERVEPEELVDLLNQYLEAMTEIVFKYGGTLDKYIGDGILVFFGDPVRYEDHVERAVRMAFEMQEKVAELRERWFVQIEESLEIGMGITTGYVTVGNIGSHGRLDYTVIGNYANLASRLADQAKAGQILVSERTYLAVRHFVDGEQIDEIQLQGVHRPISIFDIKEKEGVPQGALSR